MQLGPSPRFALIGGSAVHVDGKEQYRVRTPFGDCLVSIMDADRRVLFANRHLCTPGTPYSPPHLVDYRSLVWALVVECGSTGVVAIASTGTLHPEEIPVGSVVMPDDYAMARPEAITFWGHPGIGIFDAPQSGGVGRVHYTPADPCNEAWLQLRNRVQCCLASLLDTPAFANQTMAQTQQKETWPFRHGLSDKRPLGVSRDGVDATVYVSTVGPRFETRAEIRHYQQLGHVVGMTCGSEWSLCEELQVPYCLVCFCDNSCNGLSQHPQGPLQEYLDHKKGIAELTSAVVYAVVTELASTPAAAPEA